MRIQNATRVLALLLFILAGCAPAYAATTSAISSGDVEEVIDSQFVPLLRSYDANLNVSLATCPDKMDFSGGKTAYCTITVNGVPLRVGMVYDATANQLNFAPSSFFEFDQVERLEKGMLFSSYGIKADVNCGDPRYRLMAVGTIFTCSVRGSTKLSTLSLRAEADGQLTTLNPSGLSSPAWITTAIDEHKAGKQTVLDGPTVAKWIQQLLDVTTSLENAPKSAISVRCPSSVDITGAKHAVCIVTALGHDIRREVFFDPVIGIDSKTLDVPVDLANVQRAAQNDLNDRLQKAGRPTDGVVRCDAGILVITPPGTFTCAATANGRSYKVRVTVEDAKGTAHWRFISEDTSPTPTASGSPRP